MKFCSRCGCNLEDDAEYCPECGMSQTSRPSLNIDKRKGNGRWIMLISAILSAALFFCLTYFLRFYLAIVFIPFIFFGRGGKTTADYIIIGVMVGLLIGYFAGVLALFIPTLF